MNKKELTQKIKALAIEAGFDKVGVAEARLSEKREADLLAWLASGYAGAMDYMTRDGAKRARPSEILPGAKSVLSLALNYYHAPTPKPEGRHGRVALYAQGRDYHKVIHKKLKALSKSILALEPGAAVKAYVDTGPIMEKAFAQAAGIGFYGKNTNILTVDRGSWVFLASLITTLELEPDAPHAGGCGSCRLCLDACPTGALVEAYKLDANKCISYWTIESKVTIPPAVEERIGDWIFGCDACQDVCPFNRKAKPTAEADLLPENGLGAWIDLDRAQSFATDEEFIEYAKGTPIKRPKRDGLARNARAVSRSLTTKTVPEVPGTYGAHTKEG